MKVEPRNQIFALEMVEDYRNALTWLSQRPEVDSNRIGIWGTSYSGGLCLYVGTHDKRVKAVVAEVPSTINAESLVPRLQILGILLGSRSLMIVCNDMKMELLII